MIWFKLSYAIVCSGYLIYLIYNLGRLNGIADVNEILFKSWDEDTTHDKWKTNHAITIVKSEVYDKVVQNNLTLMRRSTLTLPSMFKRKKG